MRKEGNTGNSNGIRRRVDRIVMAPLTPTIIAGFGFGEMLGHLGKGETFPAAVAGGGILAAGMVKVIERVWK